MRKEKVVAIKNSKGINVKSNVVLALDYSGSMSSLYKNGTVQSIIDRILPVSLGLDDDGKLDFYLFDDGVKKLKSIDIKNYQTYVHDNISGHMGGTNYSPVLRGIFKNNFCKGILGWIFGLYKKVVSKPTYIIFITDGDNFDKSETTSLIKKMSGYGVFIQFIGIGGSSFRYLEKLDDMGGREVDNCDFFSASDINHMSDDELYIKLLDEYPSWVLSAKDKGFIN